jgi:hypothetical protein
MHQLRVQACRKWAIFTAPLALLAIDYVVVLMRWGGPIVAAVLTVTLLGATACVYVSDQHVRWRRALRSFVYACACVLIFFLLELRYTVDIVCGHSTGHVGIELVVLIREAQSRASDEGRPWHDGHAASKENAGSSSCTG